ncbi:MAG TPA: hypothetical protein VEY67_08050 [Candidatus Dormibacteraeota bacterium]|nr:hypothetical protein [Candidatus Dormibacteraeota bacterium]
MGQKPREGFTSHGREGFTGHAKASDEDDVEGDGSHGREGFTSQGREGFTSHGREGFTGHAKASEEDDVEGHSMLPMDVGSARQLAGARESEIRRHLQRHDFEEEGKRPHNKQGR